MECTSYLMPHHLEDSTFNNLTIQIISGTIIIADS